MSLLISAASLICIVLLIARMYPPLFWVNTSRLNNYLEMKYTVVLILIVTVSILHIVNLDNIRWDLYLVVISPFYTTVVSGVISGEFSSRVSYWEIINLSILPVVLPVQTPFIILAIITANVFFVLYCYSKQEPLRYKTRVLISSLLVYLFAFANVIHLYFTHLESITHVITTFLWMYGALAYGHRAILSGIINPKNIPRGKRRGR